MVNVRAVKYLPIARPSRPACNIRPPGSLCYEARDSDA